MKSCFGNDKRIFRTKVQKNNKKDLSLYPIFFRKFHNLKPKDHDVIFLFIFFVNLFYCLDNDM